MKLNVANPATGCQKLIEVDDERKVRIFYDKRISAEVEADSLGDEWKGYVLRISGGNDKQGFPMMQGVLAAGRVRLLLDDRHPCYRPRRSGERRRKSVRGCIVGPDLAVLNLVIVKQGEAELPGLTDKQLPQRLGPKRASKIRKLFDLSKEDDVRKYVVRRTITKEGKKPRTKAPKIQRLVTPVVLQRKRRRHALKVRWAKKSREEAADYAKLLAQRRKEAKAKRQALISQRRASSLRASSKKSEGAAQSANKSAEKKTTGAVPKPVPAQKAAAKPAAKPAATKAAAKPAKAAQPAKTAAKPTAAQKTTQPKTAAKPAAKSGAKPAAKTAPKKAIAKKGQK